MGAYLGELGQEARVRRDMDRHFGLLCLYVGVLSYGGSGSGGGGGSDKEWR